jgi:hypothetical protein
MRLPHVTTTDHHPSGRSNPQSFQTSRRKALDRLFQLFEGNDAEEEIRRLKAQDKDF